MPSAAAIAPERVVMQGIGPEPRMTTLSAEGRYEVGFDAIPLDNALVTMPGGLVLIP
jgi:hypothetical protein